jgi:hypothetical protein
VKWNKKDNRKEAATGINPKNLMKIMIQIIVIMMQRMLILIPASEMKVIPIAKMEIVIDFVFLFPLK